VDDVELWDKAVSVAAADSDEAEADAAPTAEAEAEAVSAPSCERVSEDRAANAELAGIEARCVAMATSKARHCSFISTAEAGTLEETSRMHGQHNSALSVSRHRVPLEQIACMASGWPRLIYLYPRARSGQAASHASISHAWDIITTGEVRAPKIDRKESFLANRPDRELAAAMKSKL